MEWVAAAIVLALFIYAPKKMFIFFGVVMVVGIVVGTYFYYQNWAK